MCLFFESGRQDAHSQLAGMLGQEAKKSRYEDFADSMKDLCAQLAELSFCLKIIMILA